MKREIEIVDAVEINATEDICFSWVLENKMCTGIDIRKYFLDAYGKRSPGAEGFTVDIEDLEKFSFIVAKMNRILDEEAEDQSQNEDENQHPGEDQYVGQEEYQEVCWGEDEKEQ